MHRRCLARPCSARPPAFAGVIVVRGGFPLRVRGCLRADSGRRAGPGRRGRGAGSGAAPLGGVREGELLGASRCSTRLLELLGATGAGGLLGDVWCSTRWRCRVVLLGATVRTSGSAREVFDSVPGNESLHSRSRSAAFKRASCSARKVFDSVPETGAVLLSESDPGVVPLGGGRAGGASRRARCSTRCRRTGRFTWWRSVGRSARRRSSSRLASAELLPRLELPEPDERRHAGVDRFVSRCSSSRRSAGGTPLGGMRGFDLAFGVDRRVGAASRWSTSSTATQDSPFPQTTQARGRAVRTRFVDFEQRGRQRAELVGGQSAVSLLRRLVEHVADAGTYPGGRRLLDARLHRDRVGELEPDPADGPREPVGIPADDLDRVVTSGSHRVLPPASAADEPPAVPDVSAGTVCEPASVSPEVSSSTTKPPARYPEASPVAAAAACRWRTAPCSLGRSPATVSRRCTDAAGIPGAIAPCDEFLPCSAGTSNRQQGRGARSPVTAVPNTSHRRRTGPGPSERGTG